MPSIPLPFIVALLLLVLLAQLLARREPGDRPAIIFTAASALLVSMVGLRWSVDIPVLRFIQPVVAAALPPIAWLCFARLRQPGAGSPWVHLVPVALVALLSLFWQVWQSPIDILLAIIFLGYGGRLVWLGLKGPDDLAQARLSQASAARTALLVVGTILCVSGVVDALIATDFGLFQGRHAPVIVALSNLVALPAAAWAVVLAGASTAPDDEPDTAPPPAASGDDAAITGAVDTLMRDRKLYRDPDLTLNRLARRAIIPARDISRAVNRVHGCNVSQYVNAFRIEEAKHLLAESNMPVTAVMFECGFQTKSNFNREFLRLTGMNPGDYRRSLTSAPHPVTS